MGNQCCDSHSQAQFSEENPVQKRRAKLKNQKHQRQMEQKIAEMIFTKQEKNEKDQEKIKEIKNRMRQLQRNKGKDFDFQMKKLMKEEEILRKMINQRKSEIKKLEEDNDYN